MAATGSSLSDTSLDVQNLVVERLCRMSVSEKVDIVVRLTDDCLALAVAGIRQRGGSLARSTAGEPRATMDIDMAVRLGRDQVNPLVKAVRADYFVSDTMILRAVENSSSFNPR